MAGTTGERRLVASYGGAGSAARMADLLVNQGVDPARVRVDHLHDLAIVGRGKQHDEARHITVAIAPGMGRTDQLLPGWFWSTVGFIVGFVPFFLVGLVVQLGDLPWLVAALVVGVCGGLGGAAVGLVYGLSRGPELAGAGRDAPATSVLSVPADALGGEERLIALLGAGPVPSVWIVADDATVRGVGAVTQPTSDHPDAVPDTEPADGVDRASPQPGRPSAGDQVPGGTRSDERPASASRSASRRR